MPGLYHFGLESGGGTGEIEVSNFDPAPGTPIGPADPISFDVSGADAYLVHAKHGGNATEEVVFDGTNFGTAYTTSTFDGTTFTIRRAGGWPTAKPVVLTPRGVTP